MKLSYIFVFALVLFFASAGTLSAQGFCLNVDSFCNDIYFELLPGTAGYPLNGYEQGCGYKDRLMTGYLLVSGSNAYFGLVGTGGSSSAGTYGSVDGKSYVISLSTLQGTWMYNYFYISGGVAAGHGGTSTATLALCSPTDSKSTKPDAVFK